MPQQPDENAEITFTVPAKNDSASEVVYRTVHVIVPNVKHASSAEIVIRPLMFIVPIAAILVLILIRIKDTKKTDRVLSVLENVTGKINKDVKTDRFNKL